MRSPLRPLPAAVARWAIAARLLRWLDVLVAWLVVWTGAVVVLPHASAESHAILAALAVTLGALALPLRARWRPASGVAGRAVSARPAPAPPGGYRRPGGAGRAPRGPRQPVGAEHEERDRVEAPLVDEDRRLAVHEPADRPALQRELDVAAERNDGREVEPAREPGLDLMDAAALDLERVLAQEHPQVIVDGLGDERLGAVAPTGSGKAPGQPRRGNGEHERGGERRRHGAAPPGPPGRARRAGRRPLRREPGLEREGRGMLRQAALEELAQRVLGGVVVGARGAPLDVGPDFARELRGELPPVVVEQVGPDVLAVHSSISRSP